MSRGVVVVLLLGAALAALPWTGVPPFYESILYLVCYWSVLALSIGAISLLFVLIRKGAATKVTSLLYLTPPTTAVMAWALFGERFPPLAALGMVIAACGVASG